LWAAAGGALINFVLSLVLSGVAFGSVDSANVGGLALANSLGTGFEVLVLLWILRRRWHGANESLLAQTTFKTLASSLVMGLVILVVGAVWQALGLNERGSLFTILEVVVMVGSGVVAFIITAYLLKMHELQMLINMILRRKTLTEAVV